MFGAWSFAEAPFAVAPGAGHIVSTIETHLAGRAVVTVFVSSAFEELLNNPARQVIYTVELDPRLIAPYGDS
mgnify:CR=1 FL=1